MAPKKDNEEQKEKKTRAQNSTVRIGFNIPRPVAEYLEAQARANGLDLATELMADAIAKYRTRSQVVNTPFEAENPGLETSEDL